MPGSRSLLHRPRLALALIAALLLGAANGGELMAATNSAATAAKTTPTRLPSTRSRLSPKDRAKINRHKQRYLQKKKAGRTGRRYWSPTKVRVEAEIAEMAANLNKALKDRKAKRPVLIIFDGPDGAGKSSTVQRLLPAFKGVRTVKVEHFGAPPAQADAVDHVMRFLDKLPRGSDRTSPDENVVVIWDRSWQGNAVFDETGAVRAKKKGAKLATGAEQAIDDINNIERLFADKVDIIKFYLDAPTDRQAKTIAKREVLSPDKLSPRDYVAFANRKEIRNRFEDSVKHTQKHAKWHRVAMTDRGEGRKQILETLHKKMAK